MSFLSSLDISGSGLTAQKLRMDVISQNISSAQVTRTQAGTPYRRKMVVLRSTQEGQGSSFVDALRSSSPFQQNSKVQVNGVKVDRIVEDTTDFVPTYNPTHPDADEDGYVRLSNVNNTQEMIDMLGASSAYNANITAFNATKAMLQKALEIGK